MIKLTKKTIDQIFDNELKENKPQQHNILIKLYKLALPGYDNIEKIENWPTIGKETSNYLFDKFIQFDKKIHPNVMAGGLWMNNGFSWDNNMRNWVIDNSKCIIKYKENK